MAVALYARVSTTKQAEKELSIPDQLKQMRDYCARRGWAIATEYVEEGASAMNDRRPVFQQMIGEAAVTPSPFDAIIVFSLSRFFRDAIEFGLYERRLTKHGVQLISITQETNDDPAGHLARRIFSVFDEYQSVENSKHTLRAMQENARQGNWNGAPPPFGYRLEALSKRGRHGPKQRLVVDPSEAEVVRLIFDLYNGVEAREEFGLKGIASYLNQRGALRRGKQWRANQVGSLLADRVYVGEFYFNRRCAKTAQIKPRTEWVKVPVTAIISEAESEAARLRRAARRPSVVPARRLTSPTLLTGLLRCGLCGEGMTLATGKGGRYRYYKCAKRISKGAHLCQSCNIRMESLDSAVVDAITEQVLERKNLTRLLEKLIEKIKDGKTSESARLNVLRKELEDNKSRTQRLLEAIESGVLPADSSVQERAGALRARRQDLLIQISRLAGRQEMPLAMLSPKKLDRVAASLREVLTDPKSPLQKRYLHALVTEITVKGQQVEIKGRNAALVDAAAQNETGHPWVPRSTNKWLRDLDSNQGPSD